MYVTAARRCIQYYLSTYQKFAFLDILSRSNVCTLLGSAHRLRRWLRPCHAQRAPATPAAACRRRTIAVYLRGPRVRRYNRCVAKTAPPQSGATAPPRARGSTSTSASPARQPLRRRALRRQRRRCRETAPPRRGRGTAAFMLGAHPLRARAPDAPATSPARAAETAQALHRRRRRGGPQAPPRARGSPSKS